MTHLHIDFETRSTCELKTAGLHNYAAHPTTEPWCMGAAFDDEEVFIVTAQNANSERHVLGGERGLYDVTNHVAAGGLVYAHNAAFELAIWNHVCVPRYGWPVLKPAQVRCTMAMAYAMALPGSLEKAAAAVGIDMQKDTSGHRLMIQMAKPRGVLCDLAKCECEKYGLTKQPAAGCQCASQLSWWDAPEKLEQLYEYCRQDVRVERELAKRLMPLSDQEQTLWVLDQKINNRGISIDRKAVEAAIEIVQAEQDRLNKEMRRVTSNFVGFCTEVARLTAWVRTRGVPVDGLAKADVLDALENETLPEDVRAALVLRQEAGKSSTAKLTKMLSLAGEDGRLRGMFAYHGAGTGRWAGRGVQLHNLPRGRLKRDEIDDVFEVLG